VPVVCLLTSQGNVFAVAGYSLVYEPSKGAPMSGRAEPPVRSIGTDPVAFTEFYRAHADEVTKQRAESQIAAAVTR
jgi:hypothetical protein